MRCGLQILRSCGLAVADFKNYEVADLRLRTSRIRKLRTCGCGFKNPEKSLRTCGCGLRKLKFGCGFADCGLKKKLAVPSTECTGPVQLCHHKIKKEIIHNIECITSSYQLYSSNNVTQISSVWRKQKFHLAACTISW